MNLADTAGQQAEPSDPHDDFRVHLNMAAVTAQALAAKTRRWRIGFDCDGKPYTVTVEAPTQMTAQLAACEKLGDLCLDGIPARTHITECCEVSA